MNVTEIYPQRSEFKAMSIQYERQRRVLKEALEKIANHSTGESSRIACEALDIVYPIKGDTK